MSKRTLTDKNNPTHAKPKQHQDYDKILKKKFSRIYQSLIDKLLNLKVYDAVKLPTSFSRTKEKRPDFVAKVSSPNEIAYIAHVEFQTRNDDDMDKRELGYYSDLYWAFGIEVRQYVIYLGMGQPTMPTEIKHKNMNFYYKVIVLNEVDVDIFLDSENLDEVVLAILCKYDKKDAPDIIMQILEKIKHKAQNEREIYEHITDLEILSALRKLQSETKKQVIKMPIIYDLSKDLRYKEGKIEGKLEGKIEGKIEGERDGELKKTRTVVIKMLKEKTFSIEQIAYLLDVSAGFVKKIQEELKKNPKLS